MSSGSCSRARRVGSRPSCWSTISSRGSTWSNGYAAEHLEIQTADPERVAAKIINAGAIFVGPWSPVSLGDYCAGSTHVLPTGRLRLPLLRAQREELPQGGARDRATSRAALAEVARQVEVFADAEDLPAHGAAIARRFFPTTRTSDAGCPRLPGRASRESGARGSAAAARAGGRAAVRSAAARRAVCLNVNENPYPPSEQVISEIAAAVAEAGPLDEPLSRTGRARPAR